MKRTWIAVVFLILVLGAGIGWSRFMEQTAQQLCSVAEQALLEMEQAPETAETAMQQLDAMWEKAEKKLDYIVMHHQIDEAKTALTQCQQYYRQQAYLPACTQLRLFAEMVKEMAEKEQMKIENIF